MEATPCAKPGAPRPASNIGAKKGEHQTGTFVFDAIQLNRFVENGFDVIREAEWESINTLGHGAYGTVFHVRRSRTKNKEGALKIFLDDDSMQCELKILRKLNQATRSARISAQQKLNALFVALLIDECGAVVSLNTRGRTYFGLVSDSVGKCSLFDAIYGRDNAQWLFKGRETNQDSNCATLMSPSMIMRITRMVLGGLQFMHECCSIVHGDIKPSNVILVRGPWGPMAKVTDFGLSQETHVFSQRKHHAQKRPTMQALPYRSPEVVVWPQDRPLHNIERSDIWSVGCLLYEMFQGKRLFKEIKHTHTGRTLFSEQVCVAPTGPDRSTSDILYDLGLEATRPYSNLYKSIKLKPGLKITSIPRARAYLWIQDLWKKMLQFNPRKRLSARNCILYIDRATHAQKKA